MTRLSEVVRAKRWRMVLALAVAGLVLYALLQAHINLGQSLSLLGKTNPLDYLAAIAVFYASSVIRAGRWKLLLHNAGERAGLAKLWRILMVGWFLNGIVPAKPGDLYRARVLGKTYHSSASKALGTIAMERLLDAGVLLLLIDALGLLLFRSRMPEFFVLALFLSGAIIALTLLTLTLLRTFRSGALHLPSRVAPLLERFQAGLIGSAANLPMLLGITAFLWLMEGVRLYLVVRALPVPLLSWAQLTFVALAGSLLTAFPGLPGGLSLVEGGMVTVLAYFGLTVSVGLSVALLDRLINYWSVLLLSLLALGVAGAVQLASPFRHRHASMPAPALAHADDGRLRVAAWRRERHGLTRVSVE